VWWILLPLVCAAGLVGNTLVLLVVRREGITRTSANIYLSALAIGDNMVLVIVLANDIPF
ncbi:hypothetical protein LSAT2_010947, partial [Lamellibrachia satsuma]